MVPVRYRYTVLYEYHYSIHTGTTVLTHTSKGLVVQYQYWLDPWRARPPYKWEEKD